MGWLRRCFGIRRRGRRKDHSPYSVVPPIKVEKDPSVQRKKLGSFLLSKDEVEPHSRNDVDKERFCADLEPETPAAVRKEASKEAAQFPSANDTSSEFQSLPAHSFPKKLPENDEHDEHCISSVQLQQTSSNMEKDSGSAIEGHQFSKTFESTPTSFKMGKILSSDAINNESDADTSVHDNTSSPQNESQSHSFSTKNTSYLSPIEVADEMQTFAVVCPTNSENDKTGKDASIKLQHASESGDEFVECSENLQVVTGLSQLLIPPKSDSRVNLAFNERENSYSGKSFNADRPIIGTVAAHWTDVELEPRSAKGWDGNGIPNSTDKYKEDQKVSWHSTPFEERLEKALWSENSLPQRASLSQKPINVEDQELIDTAAS